MTGVILAAISVAYVAAFGVNVPFWDEWELGKYYERFYRGQLPLIELLSAKHNEHLVGVAFSVMLFHHLATGFDVKAILYFGLALQIASAALLVHVYRNSLEGERPGAWSEVPIMLLFLSLAPYTNILWGFQTAWYLVTLLLVVTLYLLQRATNSAKPLPLVAMAAIAALAASFCSVQGLIVWLAGAVYLALARNESIREAVRDRKLQLWGALTIVGLAGYALVWLATPGVGPTSGGAILKALADPVALIKFLLLVIATVAGNLPSHWALVIGVLIVLATVGALATGIRSGKRQIALPVALITFGMAFVLLVAVGRLPLGVAAAKESRYSAYVLIALVGVYMLLRLKRADSARDVPAAMRIARGAFAVVVAFSTVGAAYFALVHGHAWRTERGIGALVLLNVPNESAFRIERTLYVNATLVAAQVDFLNSTAQATFAEPAGAVPSSARVYSKPPPAYQRVIDNNPADREALLRLWQSYVVATDVRNAFPVSSAAFPAKLVRWASGAARDGGHYLSPQLEEFASQYERLRKSLEAEGHSKSAVPALEARLASS